MAEIQPYNSEEMGELMKKDPRLQASMSMIMLRNGKMVQEINRLHMFLYTSIINQGPIRVGPIAMLAFKENFESFTYDRDGTDFVLDIPRIIVVPEAPANGVESDKPITQ